MELRSRIESIVQENLTSPQHFLVDVIITSKNGPRKILILLDGDEGITIDDCVAMSRKVGNVLEEKGWVDTAYTLDVSSPGLDHPLQLLRQYKKNVGRLVKVVSVDGREVTGELSAVDASGIDIVPETKKGKKNTVAPKVTIKFEEIKTANVLVSFK